jgi:hypothetical protein
MAVTFDKGGDGLYCIRVMAKIDNSPAQAAYVKLFVAVSELEKRRNSKVFCVIHHGSSHICEPSLMLPVITGRKEFKKGKTLDLLIHSNGGEADSAYRLIKFLRGRYATVNALVPLHAKSAATLMCLGADRIIMGEFAHLGPVDVQLTDPLHRGAEYFSPLNEFKAMDFLRDYAIELVDFFTGLFLQRSGMSVKDALHEAIPCVTTILHPLYAQVDPIEMGEHRRSLAIGEEYANRLLDAVKNPNRERIVEKLVWKYPSHDFAIDREEAHDLGIPVERMSGEDENALLNALMELKEYGASYCGFAPALPTAKKGPAKKQSTKGVSTGKTPATAAA